MNYESEKFYKDIHFSPARLKLSSVKDTFWMYILLVVKHWSVNAQVSIIRDVSTCDQEGIMILFW